MSAEKREETRYAAVILGNMNPMIHHPLWYEATGILSSEEREEAANGVLLLPPPQIPLAKFSFGGLTITCQQQRWQIEGPDELAPRSLEILSKVFDKLAETPVTAFGNNYHFDRRTPHEDACGMLGERIAAADLGVSSGRVERLSVKANDVTKTISPSNNGPEFFHLHVICHHPVGTDGEFKRFDLGEEVKKAEPQDRKIAMESIAGVMARLGS